MCPGFLLPFGYRHSLLGSSFPRWGGVGPSLRSAYRAMSGLAQRFRPQLPPPSRYSVHLRSASSLLSDPTSTSLRPTLPMRLRTSL